MPAGILIAIHGMETGFGRFMGDTPVVSAIVTLTLIAAGPISSARMPSARSSWWIGAASPAATKGARHGELGHTQFLPGNALRYGVDGNGDGRVDLYNLTDAMASTANFLRQKGWQPGKGYQPKASPISR